MKLRQVVDNQNQIRMNELEAQNARHGQTLQRLSQTVNAYKPTVNSRYKKKKAKPQEWSQTKDDKPINQTMVQEGPEKRSSSLPRIDLMDEEVEQYRSLPTIPEQYRSINQTHQTEITDRNLQSIRASEVGEENLLQSLGSNADSQTFDYDSQPKFEENQIEPDYMDSLEVNTYDVPKVQPVDRLRELNKAQKQRKHTSSQPDFKVITLNKNPSNSTLGAFQSTSGGRNTPFSQAYSHKFISNKRNNSVSPIRNAEAKFKQAEEYTQKIQSRVNYLLNEEEKIKGKINKKVSEVEKLYQLRENKIDTLHKKLEHETIKEMKLKKKIERGRDYREFIEMQKMKRAYMDMMQFENDKKRVREQKAKWRQITRDRKNRSVVNKYSQAEMIR